MKYLLASTLFTMAVFACGGGSGGEGSGISASTPVADFSADQDQDMCGYIIELAGPERTVDCGDGVTITLGGEEIASCLDDLETFSACGLLAGDVEGCAEAISAIPDQNFCTQQTPPAACAELFQCLSEEEDPA
jgi:hypothetical protein